MELRKISIKHKSARACHPIMGGLVCPGRANNWDRQAGRQKLPGVRRCKGNENRALGRETVYITMAMERDEKKRSYE